MLADVCKRAFQIARAERMADKEGVQRDGKHPRLLATFLIERIELIDDHALEVLA